jgi:small subunit ribosomal protein S16
MALKIRLQRHGTSHRPFYRMVVTEANARRDGRFVEVLGTYEPQASRSEDELNLKLDRIDYWKSVGAKTTDTAASLVRRAIRGPEALKAKPSEAKKEAKKVEAEVKAEVEAAESEAPAAEAEAPAAEVEEAPAAEVEEAPEEVAAEPEACPLPEASEEAPEAPAESEPESSADSEEAKSES